MTPDRPANERRDMALAVQRDFHALLQVIDRVANENGQPSDVAAIRAAVERGVRLSDQLLDGLDDDSSD